MNDLTSLNFSAGRLPPVGKYHFPLNLLYIIMPKRTYYHHRGSRRKAVKSTATKRPTRVHGRSRYVGSARAAALNVRTGGLLGLDKKYVDQERTAVTLANAWAGSEIDVVASGCLCPCVQGSGEHEREGTKTCVKSIMVNGFITRDQLSDQDDCRDGTVVCVALVMDTQTNGVQLNGEDVYVNTAPYVPPRRVLANATRFKVLKRKIIRLQDTSAFTDGANTASLGGQVIPFSFFVKLNEQVNFVAGAGAGSVADMKDVSFHLIAMSSHTVATDRISWNSRVRFYG